MKKLILVTLLLGLSGCVGTQRQDGESGHLAEPLWSYDGNTGPGTWGQLDPSFSQCGEGQAQSPINLIPARDEDLADFEVHYETNILHIVHEPYTILVEPDPGGELQIGNRLYNLRQLHFHHPSEHQVNGRHFPAEIHLVHSDEEGRLAVISLLVDEGEENSVLSGVWQDLPEHVGEEGNRRGVLDLEALLPVNRTSYRYTGSLTTPPCTEGVEWVVMATPIRFSTEQLDTLNRITPKNNRPVQPTNDRNVTRDST